MTSIDRAVADYLGHIRVERGLSPNTSAAYARDLGRYAGFLRERGIAEISAVDPVDVSEFVRSLEGSAASIARNVSSVRGFHGFVLDERMSPTDPAAELKPPAVGQRLPKALSTDEVSRLLEAPDRSSVVGLRDATLLELLYGTGARISEICLIRASSWSCCSRAAS